MNQKAPKKLSCSRLTDHTRFTTTPKVGGVPLLNCEPLRRRKAVFKVLNARWGYSDGYGRMFRLRCVATKRKLEACQTAQFQQRLDP
jgi:hypothetical protein